MKKPFSLFSLVSLFLVAMLAGGMAHAEKADSAKPMNIEADALRHDDLKQISVFTGNVVVTKGTIILRGAQLEVRQDAQGYQFGVMTAEPGKRAFFRQKRDTPPVRRTSLSKGRVRSSTTTAVPTSSSSSAAPNCAAIWAAPWRTSSTVT